MRRQQLICLLAAAALLPAMPAHAYIGPGAGAGTIAVVLGILGSIFMAIVAVIWYPIKRLFGRKKPAKVARKKAPETVGTERR
jgi:hypothetical protein